MVAKTTKVTLLRGIDKLALAEGHEVEMFDVLFVILLATSLKQLLSNDFANVLEDEVVRIKICIGSETVALLCCFDNRYVGELLSLETSILT